MLYDEDVDRFLTARTERALALFDCFVNQISAIGEVTLHPAKSMIGVSNGNRRVAWVTQMGKGFIHVVFPFKQPYSDNLCFQKIAQVPRDEHQFNHHFRMINEEDVNDEVLKFMRLAYNGE